MNAYTIGGNPVANNAARDQIIIDHNSGFNPSFSSNSLVIPISAADFTPCTLTNDELTLATMTYTARLTSAMMFFSSDTARSLPFDILNSAGYVDKKGVNGEQFRALLTDKTTLRRAAYQVWDIFNALNGSGLADTDTVADIQNLKSYLVFMKRVFLTLP
jgi:hypothetical protein